MNIERELKQIYVDQISEATAPDTLSIYDCEDCGARFAAQILHGPTEPMPHHYLAAGGGEPFIGCCPVCGGTMVQQIGPGLAEHAQEKA